MTMTTSRRLGLFKKTINSLKNLDFQKVIDRCVIIDDHSPEVEIAEMTSLISGLGIRPKVVHNEYVGKWSHVHSLNLWLNEVSSEELVFHCEDDWTFSGLQQDSTCSSGPSRSWRSMNGSARHALG